jgi:hypothetical protein
MSNHPTWNVDGRLRKPYAFRQGHEEIETALSRLWWVVTSDSSARVFDRWTSVIGTDTYTQLLWLRQRSTAVLMPEYNLDEADRYIVERSRLQALISDLGQVASKLRQMTLSGSFGRMPSGEARAELERRVAQVTALATGHSMIGTYLDKEDILL